MLDWREPVWGPKGGGRKGPEKPRRGKGPEKPKHKIHLVLSLFHTNEMLLHNFHPINTQRAWVKNKYTELFYKGIFFRKPTSHSTKGFGYHYLMVIIVILQRNLFSEYPPLIAQRVLLLMTRIPPSSLLSQTIGKISNSNFDKWKGASD